MKAFCSFALVLLSFFSFATEKSPSVHDQLVHLNKYWKVFSPSNPFENQYQQLSEKALIQEHLLFVTAHLSKNTPEGLTTLQQQKRSALLEELKDYALNRVFPINLYHSKRTPYFIDDYGTACAVGQLIIKSGHQALAHQISKADNYAYIEEMNHPELAIWAAAHGFDVLELKWIQPSYAPHCPKGTTADPVCRGEAGCINLDYEADALIAPYTELFEYNDGSGWEVDSFGSMMFFVGARVGDHRITVTDSMNTKKTYEVTINEAPLVTIDSTVTPTSSNQCNGTLKLKVSNKDLPLTTHLWSQELAYSKVSTDSYFDSLCSGVYTAVMTDQMGCQQAKTITINESTSLNEAELSRRAEVFPNPFADKLFIRSNSLRNYDYRIFTTTGKLIQSGDLKNLEIKTDKLEDGLFLIEISNGINRFSQKILKSN